MALDTDLKNKLHAMDEEYGDDRHLLYGITSLTSPEGVDSSRLNMFTSQIKQFLLPLNPDVPRLSSGSENSFGKFSRGQYNLKGKWEVIDKIYKYGENSVYMLILYNKKTDTYKMVEKPFVESRGEKLGYAYNTEKMDHLDVGDTLRNEPLYQSTAFDKHGNYRYGKNAKIFATITNETLEDSLKIRRGWSMSAPTIQVDSITASVNQNDIPLNIHGTQEDWKCMPNIGDRVSGKPVFATRRYNKRHASFDFAPDTVCDTTDTDSDYVTFDNAILYDVDVYYNRDEEFPDTLFYQQIRYYYEKGCEYADKCLEAALKIKNSGSNYGTDLSFYIDKFQYWNNPEYDWEGAKGRSFSNMSIEFKLFGVNFIDLGSKLAGRYGNKGVVSSFGEDLTEDLIGQINDSIGIAMSTEEIENIRVEIMDDEAFPFTDDGPVDILYDVSASVRRLIMDSTHEIEINFISDQIWKRVKSLPTMQEKEELIFDFLRQINEKRCDFFWKMYQDFDRTVELDGYKVHLLAKGEKERFIKNVEDHGFYLTKPPEVVFRYDEIKALYERYDWIKPVPMYINRFGHTIRMMRDGVVGDMYMMILKQDTNKNFSARSTFRVNRAGLPAKDIAKKTGRSSHAKTPVKISEIYNILSSVSGRDIAEYNIYMRTSVLGRKAMKQILEADGDPLNLVRLKVDPSYINTNAEIFNAKFFCIGIMTEFLTQDDIDELNAIDADFVRALHIYGYTIYDRPSKRPMYRRLLELRSQMLSESSFIEGYPGQKEDYIWDKIFEMDEVKEFELTDDMKNMLKVMTKGEQAHLELDSATENEEDEPGLDTKRVRRKRKKTKED